MLTVHRMLDLRAILQILNQIQVHILGRGTRNPENHTAPYNQEGN